MTNITIIGNTVAPAELRFTQQGFAATSFTVAVNERKKVRYEWVDDGATFYSVTVTFDSAINFANNKIKELRA